MASGISDDRRLKLAKLCFSKEWSKAIRVLDELLHHSPAVQDICNRAFCYSKLELHKHTIKDCDRALEIDPGLLQAYILKGQALFALGKKEESLVVLEKGYEHAILQLTDLRQMLELEELLKSAKEISTCNGFNNSQEMPVSSVDVSDAANARSSETIEKHNLVNGDSELCNRASVKTSEVSAVSNGKSMETKDLECHSNGNCGLPDKSSVVRHKSNVKEDALSKSGLTSAVPTSLSHGVKQKKKFVTRLSNTKSVTVDFRLSRGIGQVNEGNYAQAISLFDQILKGDPTYPEALIARGTAYAFQRELHAAIADFTEALKFNPTAGEAWKRRGQARAALGESIPAIADLTEAMKYEPDSPDIYHERGLVNFKFKDYAAAVRDLSTCIELDKNDNSAYMYLGLALASLGEFKKAEESHLKSIQLDKDFLEGRVHLTQFYLDLADTNNALECIEQMLLINVRFAKAYFLRGLLFHGMGAHRKAIKDLSTSLAIEKSSMDSLYLRASSYQAVGEYGKAAKDYAAILALDLETVDKFVFQCLAFYQNEIALYTASKMSSEFRWFDIDGDIDPLFKEYWCKRLHPKVVSEKVFRQPALSTTKRTKNRKQDLVVLKQKTALQIAADSIGCKIQYKCPGFKPNKRQHRMAGFAAIEIAQKISKFWRSLHLERKHANRNASKSGKKPRRKEKVQFSQNRGGDCCSTTSLSDSSTSLGSTEDKPLGCPTMSWHDVYSLAVKWRQISEPCDPVVWLNQLSEEFNKGFGSNTPILLGQAKVVRYFPNYAKTLNVAKAIMKEKKCAFGIGDSPIDLSKDGKLDEIMQAESCNDLHRIVGEDFWLATWCDSTALKGKQLEGTRITVLKKEVGHDFAVRTPCMPSRWDDFDAEMETAWSAVCDAYSGEAYGSMSLEVLENVRNSILRMTYYWYNFMPLSRGTSCVGFVVLLGLLLAANMKFTGNIPEGVQVDWDAILNLNPESFIESVKMWLYPSLLVSTSWKDYPDVATTLPTVESVVAALSDDPPEKSDRDS